MGLLFLWSADSIRKGTPNGLEGALGMNPMNKDFDITYAFHANPGASTLLLFSSLPRVTKGPIPIVLAMTAAGSGIYYGKTLYALRNSIH